MPQWERHVTRESSPARQLEHELRYALSARLVREASLWVDLGCGIGVAAAEVLGGACPVPTLLVDVEQDALDDAQRALPGAQALRADLGTVEGAAAVREAIGDADAVVTCFETLPQLEDFVPCVDMLVGLRERCTVVLSVPNDAFWSIENPFHRTMWGDGAFEELRHLLPAEHLVFDQVPLAASAIVRGGAGELPLEPARVAAQRVPSNFILAFGPQAERVAPVAGTSMVDSGEERRLERQRDSELAVLAARVAQLEGAR